MQGVVTDQGTLRIETPVDLPPGPVEVEVTIRARERESEKRFDWDSLYGIAKGTWADVDPVEYIRELREDRELAAGRNRAGSSILALGELLVRPLAQGQTALVQKFRAALTPSPDFFVWDVTRDVVEKAAELRANHDRSLRRAASVRSSRRVH